ncbi:hypothetical protein JTE90_009485 [Oedothorax gibbosus]|uniref:Uncharacterized protein n=1 Tax=Oedothorax gibbosus TaxID=931172 RepID=A0AAV6UT71_9ARAC|nr:hypothetical protein JTE90_009485 [Oedothorax gibbosus]
MADFRLNEDNKKPFVPTIYQGEFENSTDVHRSSRNKSVQWADWELKDVMEFSENPGSETLIDEYSQTELEVDKQDPFSLIDTVVQAAVETSSLASRSSFSPSLVTCTTMDEDEERQAAISDLITHLEDTAALLREHLRPSGERDTGVEDMDSFEQTTFLLKYQIVLVLFTQLVSILVLSLFDHLTHIKVRDTEYHILTIACGSILQILNMLLVSFATAVLSRQMLKYKVEGSLMAQTYLATVITFGGLYFMIYRIEPSSWEFGSSNKIEDNIAIGQYIQLLYLSVSAATLCGAANIQPNAWYVTLILCFQSLINFVYFASILAQTIGNYHSYTVQVRRSSSLRSLKGKS